MTITRPSAEQLSRLRQYADLAAIVGQFLNDVDLDDVVMEMVQNDLDQGASRTEIFFGPHSFRSTGDGRPVDAEGWERLRAVVGAGGSIAPKRNGIGTKNHGLRTLFLLGNYITVRSAGLQTLMAVTVDERTLDPMSEPQPLPDPDPVGTGAIIEVPYRTEPVRPRFEESELPHLQPPSPKELRRIFDRFVAEAPWRLLGCVAPWRVDARGRPRRYELVLHHHDLPGPHRFSCRLGRGGQPERFRRVCIHTNPAGRVSQRREQACSFTVPAPETARVPSWFAATGGRVRLELSWPVDKRGSLVHEQGGLRYPLGYPAPRTGQTGFTFSAPFVSNTARHDLAAGQRVLHEHYLDALTERIPRTLSKVALRDHGPAAMDLLFAPGTAPGPEDESPLLEAVVDAGAIPVAGRRTLPFRVPIWSDRPAKHARQVAEWIPRYLPRLDARAPGWLRAWLAASDGDGRWVVVRERDLLDLFRRPDDARACPWPSESAFRDFMKSRRKVSAVLDLLGRTGHRRRRGWPRKDLNLPDVRGVPSPVDSLHRAEEVPPSIPGAPDPRLVRADLCDHPVVRTAPFSVPAFDESAHAALVDVDWLDSDGKAALFEWVLSRGFGLGRRALRHLKPLPIWRSTSGILVPFADLCEPRQKTVRQVLGPILSRPDARLLRLSRSRRRAGSLLAVRETIRAQDVEDWYSIAQPVLSLASLEAQMRALARLKELKPVIAGLGTDHQTLAADGTLAQVRQLHLPGPSGRFGLLPEDTVHPNANLALVKLLGARQVASAEALDDALTEDVRRDLLESRLGALFARPVTEREPVLRRLRSCAIVPCDPQGLRPDQVAQGRDKAPDFWGSWRTVISETEFSTRTWGHLKRLGAVTPKLSPETSIGFFQWLRAQPQDVLRAHIPQVIRHWKSSKGPSTWAEERPGLPCLPVISGAGIGLLEHRRWHRAWLPDHHGLQQAMIGHGSKVPVVVERWEQTRWRPHQVLRGRVQGLREAVKRTGAPKISGPGPQQHSCEQVLAQLARRAVRERLPERLAQLAGAGVQLRSRWLSKLDFQAVRSATRLVQRHKIGNFAAVPVEVRFAEHEGVLWLASSDGNELEALYEALAEIMLVGVSRPMHAMALGQAIQQARSPQQELRWAPREEDSPDEVDDAEREPEPSDDPAHGPLEPDPAANLPTDHKLTDNEDGGDGDDDKPGDGKPDGRKRKAQKNRPTSRIEKRHRAELFDLYAAHCQVCLAKSEPLLLAPPASYVGPFEVRKRVMSAHHVHLYSRGGARHGGNLLVLCELHHRNLGDDLSPDSLERALRQAKLVERTFHGSPPRKLQGRLIVLDTPKGAVEIFFHPNHLSYWLNKAGSAS